MRNFRTKSIKDLQFSDNIILKNSTLREQTKRRADSIFR